MLIHRSPGYTAFRRSFFDLYLLAADALFQNTGLERAGPVSTDIDDLAAEYNLQKPEAAADGPGSKYAE